MTGELSVLVLAPRKELSNLVDWVSAANGRKLTVLHGMVTVREALSHIASGSYSIIHFATDGCPTALEMSDGIIPDHLLEDALRAAGHIDLVVLNACSTVHIAAQLYMAGVPRVLGWRVDVRDTVAGEWARVFYSSLAMSNDIWDAKVTAEEAVKQAGFEPPIFLNGRLAKLEAQVQEMHRNQIAGAPKWLLPVLAIYGIAMLALLARLVL